MNLTSVVVLGSLVVFACSKSEETKPESATTPNRVRAVETIVDEKPATPAPKELPAMSSANCEDVVDHLIKAFPETYESGRAKVVARCNSEWSAPMRECMSQAKAKNDPLMCEGKVRGQECAVAFERLAALAALEERNDPALASKKEAFATACLDVRNSSRKCMLDATTLTSFRACKDIAPVSTVVASPALGWPVAGLDRWAWPTYFKGQAAERLSRETLKVDSEVVHPTLRIACDEGAFKMSVWSRMSLHDGGGEATIDTHLQLDGSQELKNKATIKMGEHIHFTSPEELATELRGHISLKLEFDLPDGKSAVLTFGLGGIEAVLEQLGDCTR